MATLHVLVIETSDEAMERLGVELMRAGFVPEMVRVDDAQAMAARLKVQRFDVVLAGADLPHFSTASTLETLQGSPQRELPLVVVADNIALQEAVELMYGGAYDVVSTCEAMRLGPVLRRALSEGGIRQERLWDQQTLRESNVRLRDALAGTVYAIVRAVEARDPYTAGHQRRVVQLAEAIAQGLGFDPDRVQGVRLGAAIHDIGKITIPAELLTKPSDLSPIEYEVIKTHTRVGKEILGDVHFPWPVAEMVYQHHERLDGSGYPHGLKGGQIGLEVRIIGVADVVEAMVSYRPYRPVRSIEEAMEEIRAGRGVKYDDTVVDACISLFECRAFTFESQF